jgi:hypothetical protein
MDKVAWPKATEMHLIVVDSTRLIVETCWSRRRTITSHKSYPQHANLARIRYDCSTTMARFENQKPKVDGVSRLSISKVPLYSSQQLSIHYPSILNYIDITIQVFIQIISTFHGQLV